MFKILGVYLANGSQLDISIDNDYNGLVIRNGICKQINLKGEEEKSSKKFYDEIGNGLQDLKSNRNRNKRERSFSFFSFVQKLALYHFLHTNIVEKGNEKNRRSAL